MKSYYWSNTAPANCLATRLGGQGAKERDHERY